MDMNDVKDLLEPHAEKMTNGELIRLKAAKVSAVTQGAASEEPQQGSIRCTTKEFSLAFGDKAAITQSLK
jgi:hypothetical protein